MMYLECFEHRKYDFQRYVFYLSDLTMRGPHLVKSSDMEAPCCHVSLRLSRTTHDLRIQNPKVLLAQKLVLSARPLLSLCRCIKLYLLRSP